jgi:hypothetical protein
LAGYTNRANITALPIFSALPQLLIESPERQPAPGCPHRSNHHDRRADHPHHRAPKKKAPAKKSAKKPAAKKTGSTKRAVSVPKKEGVIASIIEIISRERCASTAEILEVLVKKFPDRDADGMKATIRIQANRNATSKERDEKRGLVYFKRR